MAFSVNTNYGASIALQSLTATNKDLTEVQNRISTGLKVSSAKDNGAVFSIAQGQRARVTALASVSDGINRVGNVVDAALTAGTSVSDLLNQLKSKAVAAQSADLSQAQRDAYNGDFAQIRNKINTIVSSATFNGANLVDNTTASLRVLQSDLNTGTGAGNVATVSGSAKPATATTPSRSDLLINASEDWAAANTLVANDYVVFTQGANKYAFQVGASTTVQQFVDGVNAATGGRITASYNGNAAATSVAATDQADTRPSSTATIIGYDLRVGGTGALNGLAVLDIGGSTTTGATTAVTALDTAITTLNSNLATLGSQSKALDIQSTFLQSLSDTIEKGLSNLVDADLAKESARLQSLQVKQQLGAQALSIANQSPQVILSFFR